MSLTVIVAAANPQIVANQNTVFTATISNTNTVSTQLISIQAIVTPAGPQNAGASASCGARVQDIPFQIPNRAPTDTTQFPTIAATTGTLVVPFSVVFYSPNTPGESPQNQPGGAIPGNLAQPIWAEYVVTVLCTTNDVTNGNTLFSYGLVVGVLSSVAPFPIALGGAFQFQQGANLINLVEAGFL